MAYFLLLGAGPASAPTVKTLTKNVKGKGFVISSKTFPKGIKDLDILHKREGRNDISEKWFIKPIGMKLQQCQEIMDNEGYEVCIISNEDSCLQDFFDECTYIFSVCRDGLYTTYMPYLDNISDSTHIVISLDNDENIIKTTRSLYKGLNCIFAKAVIHCVVTRRDIINDTKWVYYEGTECDIFLPPCAEGLEAYLNRNMSLLDYRLHLMENETEMNAAILNKLIAVNIGHTIITLLAYDKALTYNVSLQEAAYKTYATYLEQDDINKYLDIESECYRSLKITDYSNYLKITQDFLNCIFKTDILNRGLSFGSNYDLAVKKVEQHFEILKELCPDNRTFEQTTQIFAKIKELM